MIRIPVRDIDDMMGVVYPCLDCAAARVLVIRPGEPDEFGDEWTIELAHDETCPLVAGVTPDNLATLLG